jgi:hypothetical protein
MMRERAAFVVVVGVVLCASRLASATFIVEDRSGGQNFGNYTDSGWADSSGNVNAPGCTPNIGSRYSGTGVYFGPTRQAIFSFTPDVTGLYDISLAWTNAAGQTDTAVVLYTGPSSGADVDPWGNAGPGGVVARTTMNMYYTAPYVWNLAFNDVALFAATTYKVGIYGGHAESSPANRVISGAAMFEPIPEPATMAMLGLAGLFLLRRRP